MNRIVKKGRFGWALFFTVVGVVISAAALAVSVVALVISVKTYNDRYNTAFSDACNGQEIQCEYKANGKTTATHTLTLTTGSVYCGYYQKEGASFGKYDISCKKSNDANYTMIKSVTCQANNIYYDGKTFVSSSNTSMKYDFKVVKTNNDSTASVFVLDVLVG